MKEYILGNKIISTTPERYETTFKDMGYVPYKKKEEKIDDKEPKKKEPKKNPNDSNDNTSNEKI